MPGVARIGPKVPQRVYLVEWREHYGLTQAQLGARLGVTDMTVSRWERALAERLDGKRVKGTALPSTDVLAAISEALGHGLTMSDLLRHPDQPSADALLRDQPQQIKDAAMARIIELTKRRA